MRTGSEAFAHLKTGRESAPDSLVRHTRDQENVSMPISLDLWIYVFLMGSCTFLLMLFSTNLPLTFFKGWKLTRKQLFP